MRKYLAFLFSLLLFIHSNGQSFKWAAQVGGTDYDSGEDIAFDASGNVYMVGIFNSTADFNPDSFATYNLTSAGAQDVYVVKLDSTKHFKWAIRVGGAQQDFAYAIAVSTTGFVYVCGSFRSTADFNPGAGVYNLTSAGGSDIFILKLDTASNFIWAKQLGAAGDDDVEKFTLDHSQNLLLCGEFSGTVDFDPGAGVHTLTSTGSQDAYVLKLDANGNYVWAGRYGSSGGEFASAICSDVSNGVYVTGEFYGTVDFDPGAGVHNLTATGFNANIYVLKWDSNGQYIWADNMGNSSGGDQGTAIKMDPAGNVTVAGSYFGTVDFDPGPAVYNLTATGSNGDIFLEKLNGADGTFIFAKSMGGSTLDMPYALVVSPSGNIYVSGLYSGTADFDPGLSTYNLSASGPDDAFIVELDKNGSFIWAYGFGGVQEDFARGMNIFGTSDLYTCGVFAYTADFNPSPSTYLLTSFLNTSDAFLQKLKFCTPSTSSTTYNLCPGDSVFLGGSFQHLPGIYYDYYTAADGCDSIVTTTVIYPYVLSLGADQQACEGDSLLLDAGITGATYLWNTGQTVQSIYVSATGDYSVEVTKNNCTQSDTVHVTFHALPVVHLGNDTAFCQGQTLTLHGNNAGSLHQWSTGATTQNITVSSTGTYWLHVTNTYGCVAGDTIQVTVNPLPIVSLGIDTSICTSSSVTFNAGAGFQNYLWQDGSTNETFTLSGSAGTGIYQIMVTVTNTSGCSNSDTVQVTVNPLPVVSLGNDTSVCQGQSLTLHGNNAGSLHQWSTGATTQNINVSVTGTYWLHVTNSYGCITGDTIQVTVNPLPIVSLGNDTTICSSSSITFDAGPGFKDYLWQDGSTSEIFIFHGSAGTGTYPVIVIVTDTNGCSSSDTMLVTVVICTDVEPLQTSFLKISPNPAGDHVIIRAEDEIRTVKLYNTMGELIMYRELNPGKKSFLLNPLPKGGGIYELEITTSASMQSVMIVIQH